MLIDYAVDSFRNLFSNFFKDIMNKNTGEFEFESKEDARSFANKVADSTKQIIEEQLNIVCEDTEKQTKKIIKELSDLLETRTKPIIERAQSRLYKDFNVNFNADFLMLVDVYIKINNPKTESRGYGLNDLFKVFLQGLFDNLLIALAVGLIGLILNNPIGKAIASGVVTVAGWFGLRLDKMIMKQRYTIKLIPFIGEVGQLFEKKVEKIKEEAKEFIEKYFNQQVEIYFKALDSILCEYKNDLTRTLKDKNLPFIKLEKLQQALDSFAEGTDRAELDKLIEQRNILAGNIDQLLP